MAEQVKMQIGGPVRLSFGLEQVNQSSPLHLRPRLKSRYEEKGGGARYI